MLLWVVALPTLAAEWLRLEVTSTRQEMWVDLDARRLWWAGVCDGGRSIDRLTREGDRVELEVSELLQAELGQGQLAVEQHLVLRIEGDSGTLRLRSSAAADLIVLPFEVERSRRRSPPGCGP